MLRFTDYRFAVERQPLVRPFHFKGGFFTEKWINVVSLSLEGSEGSDGQTVTGLGGNAVLWSDPAVFRDWSEYGGNSIMSLLAERAIQIAEGSSFTDPIEAFESIRGEVHEYARRITGRSDVTTTFALNAMVALDLALWKAHARAQNSESFFDLVPESMRHAFTDRADILARVPLISYNVPVAEVVTLVRQGHRILKVKLGQNGSASEMLEKDIRRLGELHRSLEHEEGPIHYYLDANGRYPDLETLMRLLDAAEKLDMISKIIILEEPFAYGNKVAVDRIPVRVAADESLHDVTDLKERIDLGYRALALKPAGKTLSLTILMAAEAAKSDIPCFVADSACVPMLLEWNLALAAHLSAFPDLGMRIIESNGAQNYANWNTLVAEHPVPSANWLEPKGGLFHLDSDFFACSGGIFRQAGHYEELVSLPD